MATWTTRKTIEASPDEVLELLTDPEACSIWSPLDFELEQLDCKRLSAGCTAQVGGELAGKRVSFDVEVIEASGGRLSLRASGPVVLDVEYRLQSLEERSEVTAQVSVSSSGGLRGRVISTAADAAVAGMLPMAVERIARAANESSALALAA
jgi:polyketide cyclase/dehydrase/lipid transport protein